MGSPVEVLLQKMLAYAADRVDIHESESALLLTRSGPQALDRDFATPTRFDEILRDLARRQPSFSEHREAVFAWTFEERRFVVSAKLRTTDDARNIALSLTADHSIPVGGATSFDELPTRFSPRGVAGAVPPIEVAAPRENLRPAAGPAPTPTMTQPVRTIDPSTPFKKPSDDSFPDVATPDSGFRGIGESGEGPLEILDPMLHRRADPTPSPIPAREFLSTGAMVSPYVAADRTAARTALWSGLASGIVFALAAAAVAPQGSAFGAAFGFSVRSLTFTTLAGFLFFWSMTSLLHRLRRQTALGRISEDGILDEAVNVLARESLPAIAARFDRPAAKSNPLALRAQSLIRQWENRRGLVEAHQALERRSIAEERERDAAYLIPTACAVALPWIGVVGALLSIAVGLMAREGATMSTSGTIAVDIAGGAVLLALAAGFAVVIKFSAALLRAEEAARCLRAHDRIVDILLPALERHHPTANGRSKKEQRLEEDLVGSMQKIAAYLAGKEATREAEHERA